MQSLLSLSSLLCYGMDGFVIWVLLYFILSFAIICLDCQLSHVPRVLLCSMYVEIQILQIEIMDMEVHVSSTLGTCLYCFVSFVSFLFLVSLIVKLKCDSV